MRNVKVYVLYCAGTECIQNQIKKFK
jgi:hypothetical protein